MRGRLEGLLTDLMMIPGLAGHEGRVRRYLKVALAGFGITARTDRLGNLVATLPDEEGGPSVMLVAHMDQLGMVVRRIEPEGFLRVERVGGVPERALPGQEVLLMVAEGEDVPGVIAHRSHHATPPEARYRVAPLQELFVDAGFGSATEARAAGVQIGTPVVYAPNVVRLGEHRIAGTSVDDRAACAVALEIARALRNGAPHPTVHLCFSVQEEFNLRGALPVAQALKPDICLQLDLTVASDSPDMAGEGEVGLGAGPAISLLSFHGRGTLNGLIPHPALVELFEETARLEGIPLQRSAFVGALTETAYIQLVGEGVACLDLGFPCRYTHSPVETCDVGDLEGLARLVIAALGRIGPNFSLDRNGFPQ
ncbi:MAG TPA: M42 family metallopeptidase [Paracoccaceae bacterium]|nr:M42 family metallopeptidase [Paracoccaceae bacterium]